MGWPDIPPAAIELLPKDVALLCTSEEALPTNVGGVESRVFDYIMSQVPPSDYARKQWRQGLDHGLQAIAKVQFNNTWECSAVPYIPVPHLVHQHIENLKAAEVTGLMLSWTLGGSPSPNLELAANSYWEEQSSSSTGIADPISALARLKFGEKLAARVEAAWKNFSEAFPDFPFFIGVLYSAPQNFGPMNQLHATPTGLKATMIGFLYDHLDQWRRIYPADVFEEQFRKLSTRWREGVTILEEIHVSVDASSEAAFEDLYDVAQTVYLHFRSTYLQIAFVRLRDEIAGQEGSSDASAVQLLLRSIIEVVDEEIEVAKALLLIVRRDSRIGYEASNHYYYTRQDLREKVLNCEQVRAIYLAKQS
jgi:hypothetical protein